MSAAPVPIDESERLANLRSFGVLDTPPQKAFDAITALASAICETPIALISLVDQDRQWFKSKVGLEAQETPRADAFCAHAILNPSKVMLVEDAQSDARFQDNPLVLGQPDIRFYAGAPIVSAEGYALGTVCVIDNKSRTMTAALQSNLEMLSKVVSNMLEHERLLQSEARHVAENLKSHREVSNAVITTGRDLSTFVDHSYTYRHVNPVYLAYWNVALNQILDQPVKTVVGAELFDQTIKPNLDRALAGEDVHFEAEVAFKGRGLRHMEVSYLPARGELGEVIGVVVRAQDAQERKDREDELRKTVALLEHKTLEQDRFIHIISHDLREPINTINNFSSLLLDDTSLGLPPDAQKYLTYVSAGGRRIESLLDDLMGFLLLERRDIQRQTVDLMQVVNEVKDDLTDAIQRSEGRLVIEALPSVLGDPSLLRIVLQNLIANGLKFADPTRKPIVKISVVTTGLSCRISVDDNGLGIEPTQLEKVFDLFKRLHPRKNFAGTGLGLSICRRIAQLHDGDIELSSTVGKGSCFTLVLPVQSVQSIQISQGGGRD